MNSPLFFKYKPTGQWLDIEQSFGCWILVDKFEDIKYKENIFGFINEIVYDLKKINKLDCTFDDIELVDTSPHYMTPEEARIIQNKIDVLDENGSAYSFEDFKEITDSEFQEILLDYFLSINRIKDFVKNKL